MAIVCQLFSVDSQEVVKSCSPRVRLHSSVLASPNLALFQEVARRFKESNFGDSVEGKTTQRAVAGCRNSESLSHSPLESLKESINEVASLASTLLDVVSICFRNAIHW